MCLQTRSVRECGRPLPLAVAGERCWQCCDTTLAAGGQLDFVMATSSTTRRILLVEDESVIREFSTGALVSAGYEVDAVGEAQSGWEALQARAYDLLITDNQMPGLSGADLVLRVRTARMTLPVILASGSINADQVAADSALQPVSALPKPFTAAQLLTRVAEVLRLDNRAPNRPGIYDSTADDCRHWGLNE